MHPSAHPRCVRACMREDATMRLSVIGLMLTLALGLLMAAAEEPPRGRIPRLGVLTPSSPPPPLADTSWFARTSAPLGLLQGLRELGYVDGQTITIEARYAEGHVERLPALAAELVRLQVDVIFTTTPAGVRAATQATKTVPIVAVDLETEPVASGLVASLARPGGNLTGVFLAMPELSSKWLELVLEVLAMPTRIAVLGDPTRPKYSEAVIWGNSRRFPVQVTWPKTLFLGKVSSDKMRQNNELFLDIYLGSAIIFGNIFTERYLPWRRKTM